MLHLTMPDKENIFLIVLTRSHYWCWLVWPESRVQSYTVVEGIDFSNSSGMGYISIPKLRGGNALPSHTVWTVLCGSHKRELRFFYLKWKREKGIPRKQNWHILSTDLFDEKNQSYSFLHIFLTLKIYFTVFL